MPDVHTMSEQSVSRRVVLAAAPVAAVAASVGVGTLQAPPAAAATVPPTTGAAFTTNNAHWHLARRGTSGASPYVAGTIYPLGPTKWLDYQLNPSRLNDSTYDKVAARFGSQSTPIWAMQDAIATGRIKGWEHKFAVQCEHVARLAWSQRQLQALMTDFWANHLNVAVLSDDVDASRGHYQYTLRTRALGRYTDLLLSASQHPAMLAFLDNRSSRRTHPNENQGRELLELHTLGVGNYTETDVLNSTRVLTGLSVDNESGEFEYKPWYHWTGTVKVLGWKHTNASQTGGLTVARSMLTYLAKHPATAKRLCTKLAQYFVADSPPSALVARMVKTYLASGTAIAPTLRVMFLSAEFRTSYGAVTPRPLESVLATVRALGLGPDASGFEGVKALVWAIGDAGQSPMDWPTPDGYPQAAAAWGSTSATLQRWNFNRSLVGGWWPSTLTRSTTLLKRVHPTALPATHGALLDNVTRQLFGRTLGATNAGTVLTFLGVSPTTPLTATSPAVTWRLEDWVTLLLDSPFHVYR